MGEGVIKEGAFCIKSIDFGEVLRVGGTGFRRCNWLKERWAGREGVAIKRDKWNIKKSSSEWGDVDKWKCVKWVAIFPKDWYCPDSVIRLYKVTSNKCRLHIWRTVYL